MKAVGYLKSLPIEDPQSLVDLVLPEPEAGDHDLLVDIHAVSVNPIDVKTRMRAAPAEGKPRVLGFDAAGVVKKTGKAVKGFKTGDAVFYAGTINRQGSNADLQAVDYRIAALKPQSLDFAAAAALPLTALTAWEMLFDRLKINEPVHRGKNALLMVGAAGGVGSMAIQLARLKSDVTVIGTASRPQSRQWVEKMGAHHVINHKEPFGPQLKALGIEGVAYIFSTAGSADYLPQFVDILAPQGRFGLIDDPKTLDILSLKPKSLSVHWESMFTRSQFATDDMAEQGHILSQIAALVDEGKLQPTGVETLSPLNAATMRQAHHAIESGKSIGKLVVKR